MKKNLTRKLALSAVTMGVAALTVTSTTYAWYTTNNTASANTLKAGTQAAEGNLLIRNNNGNDSSINEASTTVAPNTGYSPSITLTDMSSAKLMTPAQLNSDNFVGLDGSTAAIVNNHYVWFSVDVPAGKTATISLYTGTFTFSEKRTQTLTMSNTTLDSTGEAKDASSISVGLEDVLAMRVTTVGTATSGVTYSASDKNYRYLAETTDSQDALVYYNNVMGLTGKDAKTRPTSGYSFESTYLGSTSSSSMIALATISNTGTAQTNYKFGLCFTLFIDGWDKECYNAIGGQSITAGTFNFQLTTTDNENNFAGGE